MTPLPPSVLSENNTSYTHKYSRKIEGKEGGREGGGRKRKGEGRKGGGERESGRKERGEVTTDSAVCI